MKKLLQILGAIVLVMVVGIGSVVGYLYLKNKNRFQVSSNAMAPTLVAAEVVEGDRHAYEKSKPQAGDIIVFRIKDDDRLMSIARIVGVPGDKISFPSGKLEVNGKPVQLESRALAEPQGMIEAVEKLGEKQFSVWYSKDQEFPFTDVVTLAEGQYFVSGDNRNNSKDSRFDGPVDDKRIVARLKQIVESEDKARVGRSL